MNRMKELINMWKSSSNNRAIYTELPVQLTAYDYARIKALAELFPARTEQQILNELVTKALDEVEEAFPYVKGDQVVAEDEYGDPIYADEGLTPMFVELTKKHETSMK
ncbi:MAG: type 1 pili tip component [Thioalkalispiraceae bacterium]